MAFPDCALPDCALPRVRRRCKQGTGCEHNELVLSERVWSARLPEAIEAVFYNAYASEEEKQWARSVHAAFLAEFQLTEEVTSCRLR